ncbi:GAF domain-containing protein [Marinobacter salicampi]|uniref:GAF domain-containing protein n=1 Tax=Marinobacter salicampi TaxID=435907 RepID=UPI001409626D|nr:GAF domain-containing protein [Marinobacter salicampi]
MKKPPLPLDEPQRLEALLAMGVLDTPVEERFERITRLARKFFGTGVAAVTLVDAERQWFKAVEGLDIKETPKEVSFCAHALLDDEVFLVEDAQTSEAFKDNPLVTGEPYIRFYAGIPLHSPGQMRVGTLCIIDDKPRRAQDIDISVLRDLAALAEREFCLESPLNRAPDIGLGNTAHPLLLDEVTSLWNWDGITRLLEEASHRLRLVGGEQTLVWLQVNYSLPPDPGVAMINQVQRELARELLAGLDYRDTVGRIGGGQFMLILDGVDRDSLVSRLGLLCDRVRGYFLHSPAELQHLRLTARCGAPLKLSIADLLDELEQQLPDYTDPLGTLSLDYYGVRERIRLLP